MQPINRIAPDEGYVLCYDCDGVAVCWMCEGKGRADGQRCQLCSGRQFCVFCRGAGQVRPAFFPDPNRVLRAHSSEECRLYFALNPHECGEKKFPARAKIVRDERGLIAVYEATCPRCGKERRVEFILDDDKTAPSKLLDPGELLWGADQAAKQVPSSIEGLDGNRRIYAREKLTDAVMWMDEVMKFLPPGKAAIPASAFFSEVGTRMYREEMGRFERARLEAVRSVYRDGLRQFEPTFMDSVVEAMRRPEDPAELARIQADHDRQGDIIYITDMRAGERPPVVRSQAEMEFAAQLESCPQCGARGKLGSFGARGNKTSWHLDAVCESCGTKKTFDFATRSDAIDPTKVVPPAGELGPRASRQIRFEQFEAELARVWQSVDTDSDAWRIALVCINELIKLAALDYRHEPWIQRREELMRKAPS